MATVTPKYFLKKPLTTEKYDVTVFNENADKIDAELDKRVEKVAGKGLSTADFTAEEKAKLALAVVPFTLPEPDRLALVDNAMAEWEPEFATKYAELETEYATDLTGVKSQLAQTVSKADGATLAANAMASGSPKGVYATLVALQTAFPTGTSGAYLVTADGKWYYYNAGWIAGGIYQATGNSDASIEYKHLSTNVNELILKGETVLPGLSYDTSLASVIESTTNLYVVNKKLSYAGKIKSITLDCKYSAEVGYIYILKQDAVDTTKFTVVSKASFVSVANQNNYAVDIDVPEKNLFLGIKVRGIKYGNAVTNYYNWYEIGNVNPTNGDIITTSYAGDPKVQFGVRFNITIESDFGANIVELQTKTNKLDSIINDGYITLKSYTYDVIPTNTTGTGLYIIDRPMVRGVINELEIQLSGTSDLNVYILKKDAIDTTKFTVVSKTNLTPITGLNTYTTNIELLEDGLFLGFSGSVMYKQSTTGDINYYKWYDEVGNFNTNDVITNCQINAAAFQFCIRFDIRGLTTLTSIREDVKELQNAAGLLTLTPYLYKRLLITKTLHIGDSLTQGIYGDAGNNIHSENYPYYFSKLMNVDIVNNGHSGYTPTTIWNSYTKNIDFTPKFNLIYIMLGTNEGLTDTLIADTTIVEGQTYENYANTNVGNYCKIIEYCKAQSPDSIIILCTTPYPIYVTEHPEYVVTNNVIKQIAAKYGLKVFDIYNECKLNSVIYHPYDVIHFGKLGYLELANYIYKQTIQYLSDDNIAKLIKPIN